MNNEIDLFIEKYVESLDNGNAAIFAGAGLSMSSGCVNWRELLTPVAQELDLDITKEHDLVAVAQYYVNKDGGNRNELNRLIYNEFTSQEPNDNHNLLAQLPISTYWTTNYDHLIEKSLETCGKKYDVKASKENLTLIKSNCDAIVYKMHGDCDHPNQTILTRDDYESYYYNQTPFINALSSDLMTKTFLFLGFSFSDPNISYILSHLRVQMKDNIKRHYCIMKRIVNDEYQQKLLSYQIEDLKRFGIQTLLVDDYSDITNILLRIKNRYNRKTIFISGAACEYGKEGRESYELFINQLCATLIKNGYRIVSGYGLGVGSAVVSGVLNEVYFNQHKKLDKQLILRPFPLGEDRKKMWNQYRQDMISYSGISLFILGNKMESGEIVLSNGVRSEYEISKQQGNFLIPIGRTGYMANELWAEYMDEISKDARYDKVREDLFSLGDPTISLSEIINIIIKIFKKIN